MTRNLPPIFCEDKSTISIVQPLDMTPRQKSTKKSNSAWALFLDFDGTLVDIASSPSAIQMPGDLLPLLARLHHALDGALAIVTGRPVSDIDAYLVPLRPIIAGACGAELRVKLNQIIFTAPPMPTNVVSAVRAFGGLEGVSIEIKRSSVALHFRSNPKIGPEIEAGLQELLAEDLYDLTIRPGRKVFEVMPKQVSKAGAVEALLQFPQFRGRRPIFIGDDSTDESAFEFVERLGGKALRVAGEHFSKEIGDFEDPADVRSWLAAFAASYGV